MPNRPGNDDRITGAGDRERQREVTSDGARQTGSSNAPQPSGSVRSRSNRGFASMDPAKQKEIASKGGRAAHAKGTAHEFDSGEAREAGRKGGMAVSRNREHMAAIGRRGGEARGHARNRAATAETNTGANETIEGGFQNTRAGAGERQVAFDNQPEGVTTNTQGTRGGTSPLGGERRPTTGPNTPDNRDTFGNH
jgi:general stress protein YciG